MKLLIGFGRNKNACSLTDLAFAVLYVIPYFAVVIVTIYYSYVYSKRRLSFLKLPDSKAGNSAIYVKGGLSMSFLYVAALTILVVINSLLIG
jgi:hypothetical protein